MVRDKKGQFTKGHKKLGGIKKGGKHFNLKNFFNEKETNEVVDYLKANYQKDIRVLQMVVEHIFQKPKQDHDITSGGKPIPLIDYTKK